MYLPNLNFTEILFCVLCDVKASEFVLFHPSFVIFIGTMESNGDHPEQNFSPLSVQEVDVDFLPIVYEIIRRYLHVTCFIFRLSLHIIHH